MKQIYDAKKITNLKWTPGCLAYIIFSHTFCHFHQCQPIIGINIKHCLQCSNNILY